MHISRHERHSPRMRVWWSRRVGTPHPCACPTPSVSCPFSRCRSRSRIAASTAYNASIRCASGNARPGGRVTYIPVSDRLFSSPGCNTQRRACLRPCQHGLSHPAAKRPDLGMRSRRAGCVVSRAPGEGWPERWPFGAADWYAPPFSPIVAAQGSPGHRDNCHRFHRAARSPEDCAATAGMDNAQAHPLPDPRWRGCAPRLDGEIPQGAQAQARPQCPHRGITPNVRQHISR